MFLEEKLNDAIKTDASNSDIIDDIMSILMNHVHEKSTKGNIDIVISQTNKTYRKFCRSVNNKRKNWYDLKLDEDLFENNFTLSQQ